MEVHSWMIKRTEQRQTVCRLRNHGVKYTRWVQLIGRTQVQHIRAEKTITQEGAHNNGGA